MPILENAKLNKLKEVDPLVCQALTNASTLIDSGYPTLADQRISWINKASEIMETLIQFRSNYQFIMDELTIRIKYLENKEYQESIENDQYKSWNEKSLLFYGNNQLVDFYRQNNFNRYVITMLTEFINLIKYMSR